MEALTLLDSFSKQGCVLALAPTDADPSVENSLPHPHSHTHTCTPILSRQAG